MAHVSPEGAVCLTSAAQSDLVTDCGSVSKAITRPSERKVSACVLHCHVPDSQLNYNATYHQEIQSIMYRNITLCCAACNTGLNHDVHYC